MVEIERLEKRKPLIRRVSLFKKRKKPKERPLVRVHKSRNYKRLLLNVFLVIVALFIIAIGLFIVRNFFFQSFIKNQVILTPRGSPGLDNNQIKNIIQNKGLDITNIEFSTTSASISFTFREDARVILSKDKEVVGQLDLVEAIDNQLLSEGKKASYIDLRYNKPVVKTQ